MVGWMLKASVWFGMYNGCSRMNDIMMQQFFAKNDQWSNWIGLG